MSSRGSSLDDKYMAENGQVLLSGIEALVRLPLDQIRRDRGARLKTAGFISGYRGSPLSGYDQRLMKEKSEELNPVELLRSLLKDANLSQTELSKAINVSRQIISDVLNYRRNISKDMTIKLSKFFSMSQEAFSREYQLKSNENKLKKKRMYSR